MVIRWIVYTVNVFLFAGSFIWLISIFREILTGAENSEQACLQAIIAVVVLIISVIGYIIRKAVMPLPGIDYK